MPVGRCYSIIDGLLRMLAARKVQGPTRTRNISDLRGDGPSLNWRTNENRLKLVALGQCLASSNNCARLFMMEMR